MPTEQEKYRSILILRDMLREMEQDLGLDKLNQIERDVLLAAQALTAAPGDEVESRDIRNHKLVRSIAQATYHRALRTLLSAGFLSKPTGVRSKRYVVSFQE